VLFRCVNTQTRASCATQTQHFRNSSQRFGLFATLCVATDLNGRNKTEKINPNRVEIYPFETAFFATFREQLVVNNFSAREKSYFRTMKILLISSNPDAKVPNEGYDLYVHFTSAPHLDKTPFDKTIMAVRKFIGVVKAGTYRWNEPAKRVKKVISVGWPDDVRSVDPNIELIDLSETPYPVGKSPTSGMAATYHFLNRGHEVHWCGFDLSKVPRFGKGGVHAWYHEYGMQRELIESGRVVLVDND